MLAFRRRRLCLPVALALAPLGCQSILGINTDRPFVAADGGDDAASDVDLGEDTGPGLDVDTGTMDVGTDASGSDDGPPGSDAADASDAADSTGPELDAPGDAPPPPSFANPVQVDVTMLFNANSVVTTAVGGATLTPMDGNGANASNDFPTASELLALSSGASGQGLPDNAFFLSSGPTIPNVQLAWNNGSNVLNSIVLSSTSGQQFTFKVPEQRYTKVQLYATGAGAGSTLNYALNYVGGTPTASSMSLPDWCVGTPGAGQYVLASVYRVQNGVTLNTQYSCHIYALDLNPDPAQVLQTVTFWDTGQAPANFVFYGATAW